MPRNPETFKRIYTAGRVLLFCLGCAVVLAATSRLLHSLPGQWSQLLLAILASIGAFLLTLLFVRLEGLRLRDVGISVGPQSISRLLTGFIIGLFLASLHSFLVLMSGHLKIISPPEVRFSTVMMVLLLYSTLSCREELAFHGYPLRSLNYAIGPWGAQLIVAFVFAAEHVAGGLTWMQALSGPAVGSLLFGIASLKTKGLALPIGLHAAWNFGQWSLGFKNEPGIWQMVIEKGYASRVENIGVISYLAVMGLAILAFYLYYRKRSE